MWDCFVGMCAGQDHGVVAGLASEMDFPKSLPDSTGLGLCLSHTRKHFSILPSLRSVLLQSFSPAHPIYNSCAGTCGTD